MRLIWENELWIFCCFIVIVVVSDFFSALEDLLFRIILTAMKCLSLKKPTVCSEFF